MTSAASAAVVTKPTIITSTKAFSGRLRKSMIVNPALLADIFDWGPKGCGVQSALAFLRN
jgi:hypothetical protein